MKNLRILIVSHFGLIFLLLLGGCGSTPEAVAPAPLKKNALPEANGSALPEFGLGQPVADPYSDIIKKLEDDRKIGNEQKTVLAERYYRIGVKFYLEGDYEKAKKHFERASQLGHPKAEDKLNDVRSAQGESVDGNIGRLSRNLINAIKVKIQQARLEVENHLYKGIRAYEDQKYDEAEEEFKWVIESVEWFPYHADLSVYQKQAKDYLKKNQGKKESQAIALRRKHEAEARRRTKEEEIKRREDFVHKIEMLFRQSQEQFEKENYDKSVRLCNKILSIDPSNRVAKKLKDIALATKQAEFRKLNTKTLSEEWKKTFEFWYQKTIPQVEVVKFPDKKKWKKTLRRGPRKMKEEKPPSPLNQEAELLLDRRLNFPFGEGASLAEIIQFVRDYVPGINIIISSEVSAEEQVTYNVVDIPLRVALSEMLKSQDWGYIVQDGVIIITSNEKIKASKVVTSWYDILDLTIPIVDFPGPQIGLEEEEEEMMEEESEIPRISGDELKKLIEDNIAKSETEGWEDPFSIEFQESSGVLVVKHLPRIQSQIETLLTEIRTAMDMVVTIEARFIEVVDSFLEDIGVSMRGLQDRPEMPAYFGTNAPDGPAFANDPGEDGGLSSGIYGLYSGGNRELSGRIETSLGGDLLANRFFSSVLGSTGGSTLSYTILDNIDVSMILQAVKKDVRSKTLRAPRITIFNGQRAHIYIAQQFTYIRDYDTILVLPGAVLVDPIPDVIAQGVVLDVRPSISADLKYITLELRPSISSLVPPPPNLRTLNPNLVGGGTPSIEIPDMEYQRLRTNVIVPDGGTIMISCYAHGSEIYSQSAVPLLSKIPILGMLFRRRATGKGKNVLMIIIKSKITIMTEEERKQF